VAYWLQTIGKGFICRTTFICPIVFPGMVSSFLSLSTFILGLHHIDTDLSITIIFILPNFIFTISFYYISSDILKRITVADSLFIAGQLYRKKSINLFASIWSQVIFAYLRLNDLTQLILRTFQNMTGYCQHFDNLDFLCVWHCLVFLIY